MRVTFLAALGAALLAVLPLGCAAAAGHGDADRVGYMLGLDDVETDLALISAMVMPGADLRFAVDADGQADSGALRRDGGDWVWRAPSSPGVSRITFINGGQARDILVFVLTPFENGRQSELNGYRIGAYAPDPHRGLDVYRPPEGFIEVTRDMRDLYVSPNFQLWQFLCKQQPDHDTAYLLIRPSMLAKLESVLDAVQGAGHHVATLTVMSGFRTPWYNASIGNRTTSSRHLFGGAADVFVDADGNGWMDDLNGDGRVDIGDARMLAGWAEDISESSASRYWPAGGLGIYSANSVRGPFVHIDARGYRARW